MIKIILDTLGGDKGAKCTLEGSVIALNNISDLEVTLTGDEKFLTEELKNYKVDNNRLKIVNAPDEITCNDKPTEAIRAKKESSLCKAFELLKENEDFGGLVSTGSTGAIIAGAVLKLGRIKGIKRPAFCPILPTMNGKIVGVCDSGANVDCEALWLYQFAIMGSLYLEKAFNVKSPKVALLNIGTEEEKGDALRKEVYAILKDDKNINFVGNMEARDLLKGDVDLVVTDGFSGNILLKSTEGASLEVLNLLKKTFFKGLKNKIGALLLKKDLYKTKKLMDYNNYGGAVLLGATKTIVKGHGSSNSFAVYKCIEQAYNMEKHNLRQAISEAISENNAEN